MLPRIHHRVLYVLSTAAVCTSAATAQGCYNSSWLYRRKRTSNCTRVGSSVGIEASLRRMVRLLSCALMITLSTLLSLPLSAQTTISKRVAASSDDAEEAGPDASGVAPGTVYLNSTDLELVKDIDPTPIYGTQQVGMRFRTMSIPPGATILNAYVTFRAVAADPPMSNSEATSLTFKGQLIADAPTFSTTNSDISNRTTTSASVSWTPSSWTTGSDYDSPDLASIIQEIVNQGGWSSGNDMALIITGTGHRSAQSYDGGSANAPLLVVTYTSYYYSRGSLAVSSASNWNTQRDGSGSNASSFGSGNTWVIQNSHSMTLTGSTAWNVSASGIVQIENGGTWTNTSSGAVTTGTLQVDNGGTYSHGTTASFPGTTRTFGSTSTVNYSASANQTVVDATYGHLTLSGSGTKTMPASSLTLGGNFTMSGTPSATAAGTLNVNGNFTIGNGCTFSAASYTHTLKGDFSNSGTFTASTSTMTFNGTSAEAIGGSTTTTFNNLTLNNSAGLTLNTSATVGSTLTLSAGTLAVSSSTLTLNSTVSVTSGSLSSSSTGTVHYNQSSHGQNVLALNYGNLTFSDYNKTLPSSSTIGVAGTFTPGSATGHTITGSTVDYDGTGAQTIAAFSYNNLAISGARTTNSVTLASSGTIGVAAALNLTATFTSGTYVLTGSTIDFNSSAAQTIPAFTYNHLTLSNADVKTFAAGSSGIAGTFTVSGTASANTTTNSTTVNYNGSGPQTVVAITYHHLTLSNAGTKTFAASPITVQGNLSVEGTAAATAGAALTVNGNFSTVVGTTWNAGTYTHTFRGDYAAAGTGNYSTGTIVLGGTSAQTLSDANSFSNLTVDNANGVSLIGNTGANTALTLTNGMLTLNGYDFTVGFGGAINGVTAGRYVVTNSTGKLMRYGVSTSGSLFPIGTASAYLPVTVKTSDPSGGGVSARVTGLVTPAFPADSAAVLATWVLGYGALQRQITEATFQWNQTDEGASFVRAYAVGQFNSGSWNPVGATTIAGSNPYMATITGLSQYGSYIIAEIPPTIFYSKGSLDVSTPSNWNTARNGSGTDAPLFGRGHTWAVQNGHSTTLSGTTAWDVSSTGAVQIESGGTWSNSSSGTVTANTFQVDNGGTYILSGSATIPGTIKTLGATSTIDYAGTNQTVLALIYGNLTLSNTGTKTFSAGTSRLAGNLTISGTAAGDGVSNSTTIEYNGTGAQNVGAMNYYHLTLSNGNNKLATGNLSVGRDFSVGATTTFSAGSYTHTIQGHFSNSGTFTAGTSTVQLTGNSNTQIAGATTFNILALNKSSGATTVTLNNAVTTATLAMTQGTMVAGSNGITITSDRTGSGIITGQITRTHTFSAGPSYAFEGPYNTLTFASGGTLPTSVTVTVVLSSPGGNDDMEPIDRYYDISHSGGSGFTYTLRLHYEDSEVSSPNSETSPPLKLWRRTATSPDTWTREGASANSTTNNWVEQTGLTNVGRFTLSSRTLADMTLTLSQSTSNPSPGDQVTYTLAYNNAGDGSSTSTIITASAPANTSYVAGSTTLNGAAKTDASDADEVTVSGGNISINVGTVGAGVSGAVTYRVQIN